MSNSGVRARQGALPRVEEEHHAVAHAVCAVQPVDGAAPFDGGAGMRAPANRQGARNRAGSGPETGEQPPEPGRQFESVASARSEVVKADPP